jgi:hypothetical protein
MLVLLSRRILPNMHALTSVPCSTFYIGFQAIEFMDKWTRLGHIMSNDCDYADDVLTNKMSLIGQANRVLYNFRNVDCATKTKLVTAHCTIAFMAQRFGTSLIVMLSTSVSPGARYLGEYGKSINHYTQLTQFH